MSRTVSLLGGLACLGLAGYFGRASFNRSPAAADIQRSTGLAFEPAEQDFGEVEQNQTLQAEFRVVNHGPEVVTMADPMKSCSCASVTLDARTLDPGQSAKLVVAWRTGEKLGPVRDMVAVQFSTSATRGLPDIRAVQLATVVRAKPRVPEGGS